MGTTTTIKKTDERKKEKVTKGCRIQIPQTASKPEYARNVDLVMPGRWGGTVAERTVGIVAAGRTGFAALLGS
jgi:hypothetical protein